MKLNRRRVIAGVVVLILLVLAVRFVVPSILFLIGVIVFTRKWAKQASQARDHLFFETDYQELLAACRSLSARTSAGELRSGQYRVYLGKRDPETLSFPQVILDLQPACILMDHPNPGEVVIELFPGPEWFGVMAFPEGSEGYGAVELIEGLWYRDSGYSKKDPEYVKKIDAMIEEARRRKEDRRSASQP